MKVEYNKLHDNKPYEILTLDEKVEVLQSKKISSSYNFYLKNDSDDTIRLMAGNILGYSKSSCNSTNAELRTKAMYWFEVVEPVIKALKKMEME